MDARRLAYLEAMGIEVWQPRREPLPAAPAETSPRIVVGGGEGDILCIARDAGESASKLATDISGAMRSPPVWAWPSSESRSGSPEQDGSMTVRGAATERLLTRVLVFGEDLAGDLFGAAVPQVVGGARVHVVPALERLGRDRGAKRILWGIMCEHGIATPRASESSE